MGNYISNNLVYLTAKRVLGRYNIESRVFKEIEKQSKKPVVAPKHEAGIIDYHKSMKGIYSCVISFIQSDIWTILKLIFFFQIVENPEYLAQTTVVNKKLDDHLKDVYVTSEGLVIQYTTNCIHTYIFVYIVNFTIELTSIN